MKLWCEDVRVPTRLGYAILFVSDLDRAIGFYRDVIGVPLRFRADAYAEFATEGAKFALFPRSESEYADAYLILELCLGDRAPFGLIDFLTGVLEGEHEGAARS